MRGNSGGAGADRDAQGRDQESVREAEGSDAGQAVTRETMTAFIAGLDLPEEDRQRLLHLTPAT